MPIAPIPVFFTTQWLLDLPVFDVMDEQPMVAHASPTIQKIAINFFIFSYPLPYNTSLQTADEAVPLQCQTVVPFDTQTLPSEPSLAWTVYPVQPTAIDRQNVIASSEPITLIQTLLRQVPRRTTTLSFLFMKWTAIEKQLWQTF
jgi:hypothetical protein